MFGPELMKHLEPDFFLPLPSLSFVYLKNQTNKHRKLAILFGLSFIIPKSRAFNLFTSAWSTLLLHTLLESSRIWMILWHPLRSLADRFKVTNIPNINTFIQGLCEYPGSAGHLESADDNKFNIPQCRATTSLCEPLSSLRTCGPGLGPISFTPALQDGVLGFGGLWWLLLSVRLSSKRTAGKHQRLCKTFLKNAETC